MEAIKKEQAFRGYDGCSLSTPIYRTRTDQKNGKLLHRVCHGIFFFALLVLLALFFSSRSDAGAASDAAVDNNNNNNKIFNVATEHWMWIYRCDGAHENGNMYNLLPCWPWKMMRSCYKSFNAFNKMVTGDQTSMNDAKPMKPKMCTNVSAHASIYISLALLCNLRGQISYIVWHMT